MQHQNVYDNIFFYLIILFYLIFHPYKNFVFKYLLYFNFTRKMSEYAKNTGL